MVMKNILIGISMLVVLLLVVSCSPDGSTQVVKKSTADAGEIVFGAVGPLTGDVSVVGLNNKIGVELAIEEINAAGGINGKTLKVIYEDGRCNAKDASNAGNKLINVNNVKYIVGAACSGETLAISPLAEEQKVIMMSPLSSSPDITEAGDYIFRDYVNDNDAGRVLARKMFAKQHRKIALLYGLNDYARALAAVVEKEFTKLGGEVVIEESFAQGTTDLRSVLTKVKSSDADSIVMLEYTTTLVAFAKQRKELGVELPFYGADTYSDPALIEQAGAAFDGAKYVLLKDSSSSEFKAKIRAKTGGEDVQVGTANAYDAVKILAKAISTVGDDTTKVKEWLYGMPAYRGESGSIKFDRNGDLEDVRFEMFEIQNGESVLIS